MSLKDPEVKRRREQRYLSSTAMQATASTMALVSQILGFEIVEIWSEDVPGQLHCTYVHVDDAILEKYPDIIFGHYPQHKKAHMVSPRLCSLAKQSSAHYHWRVVESPKLVDASNLSNGYENLAFPMRTEMAFQLVNVDDEDQEENSEDNENPRGSERENYSASFIVAFSLEKVAYRPSKLKFLKGLAIAIFVAAFDLEDDLENEQNAEANTELDAKEFLPTRPHNSALNLAELDATLSSSPSVSLSLTHSLSLSSSAGGGGSSSALLGQAFSPLLEPIYEKHDCAEEDYLLRELSDDDEERERDTERDIERDREREGDADTQQPFLFSSHTAASVSLSHAASTYSLGLALSDSEGRASTSQRRERERDREREDATSRHRTASVGSVSVTASTTARLAIPTWTPAAPFSFPIAEMPVKHAIPADLSLASFDDVTHVADGSNSNIFLATYRPGNSSSGGSGSGGLKVIVKMIKEEVESDAVALREFELEFGTLARLSHPNIISILGAGNAPRRFVVLEHLGGGSLNTMLTRNQQHKNQKLTAKLFKKPTFTYANLLSNAKCMAEAMDYLHRGCHPGATIIHRDLKPDNVGFTKDGQLKLFDFGLVTCVRARTSSDEAYEMTGYTGSLRYMAPEVVLRQPYTEKADVYSFGIMLWQMARDKVPFKGLSKDEFLKLVVQNQERPKCDKGWPAGFSSLLKACWDNNAARRPSFVDIVRELNRLIAAEMGDALSSAGKHKKSGNNGLWF